MLLKTTAVFAALTLIVGAASPARAAIIYFPGQDIPIPTTFAGVSVDLETGGVVTNDLAGALGADANFFLGGQSLSNDAYEMASAPTWQPVRTGTGNSDMVQNLPLNAVVDGSQTYGNDFGGSVTHAAVFVSGTPGYIGFSLEIVGSATVFGWMRVTLNDDNTPGTIHEWAYQDDGNPIQVGQTIIPEPSHALLTCLGLGALALRRRRA